MAVRIYRFILASLLFLTMAPAIYADGDEFDDDKDFDICANPCDWSELKKEVDAWKGAAKWLEAEEKKIAETGDYHLYNPACRLYEWVCKNGYEKTGRSSYSKRKGKAWSGLSFYGYNHILGETPEPMPTEVHDSEKMDRHYSSDCHSGYQVKHKEIYSSSGLSALFRYDDSYHDTEGGDNCDGPCETHSLSFNATARVFSRDINFGKGQTYKSSGCFRNIRQNCSYLEENHDRYESCIEEQKQDQKAHEDAITWGAGDAQNEFDSLIAYLVSGSEMYKRLIRTGVTPTPEELAEVEEAEEGPFAIAVNAQVQGYEPITETLFTEDHVPSSISLWGLVKDLSGTPLSGVTVSLPDFGATATSGADGSYRLEASAGGEKAFSMRHDLHMRQNIQSVEVSVQSPVPLFANGREVQVALQVLADGVPYASNKLQVIQTGIFKVGEQETNKLTLPKSLNVTLQTDADGWARVSLPGPRVAPGSVDPYSDPQWLFPAQGLLEVRGEWDTSKKIMASYVVENPFPRISKLVIPGNIDEEHWQLSPTQVYIDDPDSDALGSWTVTVEATGMLRVLSGDHRKNKMVVYDTIRNPFEFHYQPPKIGLDLTKQPDLAQQLIDTNLKVALNMIVGELEGRLTDGSRLKKSYDIAKNALTYLDRASDTLNLVSSDKSASAVDAMTKGFDYVFNLTETSLGFLGMGYSPQLEIAKGAYENAKVIYAAYQGYLKIANAYQDVMFLPITITVEDELGHKTKKVGKCSVRVWKELN